VFCNKADNVIDCRIFLRHHVACTVPRYSRVLIASDQLLDARQRLGRLTIANYVQGRDPYLPFAKPGLDGGGVGLPSGNQNCPEREGKALIGVGVMPSR
jgi:hypothetical protein